MSGYLREKDIDDEKFWHAVDYNKQFDYPVEYYERRSKD